MTEISIRNPCNDTSICNHSIKQSLKFGRPFILANIWKVGTVSTVEDFWQLHQLLKPPSCLGLANDYAMFRQVCIFQETPVLHIVLLPWQQGVNPDWDDPANSSGGRWPMSHPRSSILIKLPGGWWGGRKGMSWTLLGCLYSIFCLGITWGSRLR